MPSLDAALAPQAACRVLLGEASVSDKGQGWNQCFVHNADEVDALFSKRQAHEHEVSLSMKTEFMSLWDGMDTDPNSKIVVMGATNRPQELDPAVLRRQAQRLQHMQLLTICCFVADVCCHDMLSYRNAFSCVCGVYLFAACRTSCQL